MTRESCALAMMIGVGLALLPARASAYRTLAEAEGVETSRVHWTSSVRFSIASAPPPGLTEADFERALALALESWRAAGCSLPELVFVGRGADGGMSGDGLVSVAFIRSGWVRSGLPADAAAITDVLYEVPADGSGGPGRIVDADVVLNADVFAWLGPDEDPNRRALVPVLIHEVGHVLGLAHVCEFAAPSAPACDAVSGAEDTTMFPAYRAETQSRVGPDDQAGLCFLYGFDVGCEVPCDEDSVCQAGACVPADCAADGCEPCDSDDACDGFCDGQYCRPPRVTAAPCARDAECESSTCTAGVCADRCAPDACAATEHCGPTGSCVATPNDFGVDCNTSRECESGLCVQSDHHGDFCSASCSATSSCPGAWRCLDVDGEPVCVPGESGCSVGLGATRGGLGWILPAIALVLATRRRRRP